MKRASATVLATAIALVGTASASILPYNPTSIFLSPNNSDVVYILQPEQDGGALITLNISSSLQASDLSSAISSIPLPFLDDDKNIAYTPAVSPSGSIGVLAGSCGSKSSLWTYQPPSIGEDEDEVEEGSWSDLPVTESSAFAAIDGSYNVNFLGASIYFSTTVETEDTNRSIYNFGGMCPTSSSVNESSWQTEATYTNAMIKITPKRPANDSYEIVLSAATGLKPVPEAGFTMTGLTPAYTNSSAGILTQAQTYVFIGGHTQQAFIGMEQVALFSLPQESWTFHAVASKQSVLDEAVALAPRSASTPDSRSGHTAVLSEDGSKIYIFGGWVGDVDTPAEPQLAVLHLGNGLGGDWMWETPTMNGTHLGLEEGEGIYGHGAVMLPGDVMMVAGGSRISPMAAKSKRAEGNVQAMLFDTKSMSWVDEYTNPSRAAVGSPKAPDNAGSTHSDSKRVAIGTGVGVGVAAILGAIAVYFWYQRKLNRRRYESRERDLAALHQTARRDMPIFGSDGEMQQRSGPPTMERTLSTYAYNDLQHQAQYGPIEYTGYDYGDDHDMSYVVPNQSLARNQFTVPRKPPTTRNSRGYYNQAPQAQHQHEFGPSHSRANSLGTAGAIHPIYEADEGDSGEMANINIIGAARSDLPSAVSEREDPFQDPPSQRGSQLQMHAFVEPPTRSPSTIERDRQKSIKEWISDWTAADSYVSRNQSVNQRSDGSLSPSKDSNSNSGRTGSNLSEHSEFSLSRNDSTSTRTKSLTAFFIGGTQNAWGIFGPGNMPRPVNASRSPETGQYLGPGSGRATAEGYYTSGTISPNSDRSGGTVIVGPPPKSAGSNSASSHSGNSFATAQSKSFPTLREQGETLLPRPGEFNEPGSPSKSKGLKVRAGSGWLGSIKKALGKEEWVPSPGVGDEEVIYDYRDSPSPTRPNFGEVPYYDGPYDSVMPQRTVSASAQLWRRKQGRGDWEDSDEHRNSNYGMQRSFTTAVPPSGREDRAEEEEWDVEKAVMGRQVQIIGTVPKERLRVVNHDVESDNDNESDIGMMREKTRSPIRDMLTGSPRRGTPDLERQDSMEMKNMSDTPRDKGKGKAVLMPSPLLHLPPPREQTPSPSPSMRSARSQSNRPLSPSKSVRSIKGGRVSQLIQQMESQQKEAALQKGEII